MYMCSTFLNFEEFLLDLTFWIMWTKLWSWNQMFLTIIFSTLYLFLFSISSPLSWRTWSVLENMHWCNKSEFCLSADDEAPILNCPNISSTTDEGLHSSSTVLLSSTATDNVDFHLDVIAPIHPRYLPDRGHHCELLIYRWCRKHWHLSSCCHSNRCEYDYFYI